MPASAAQHPDYQGTLVNAREAAYMLGIGKDTFYAMLREGTCPVPVVTLGRRRLFRRADIDRFLRGEAPTEGAA